MPEISYGRTINLGNYESERINYTDDLQPGETPEQGYARVRGWVEARIADGQAIKDKETTLAGLDSKCRSVQRRLEGLREKHIAAAERYQGLRGLLAIHGVQIDELSPWYLPDELPATPPDGRIEDQVDDDDWSEDDDDA